MRKKRAYRAVFVKNVILESVLKNASDGAATVGLDIGKQEVFAVVRWSDGTFERPWKVKNPSEIDLLTQLLRTIAKDRSVKVALESTGTYGDALRQALTDAELDVQRVGAKAASDYAEIFDGVPSKHDGKDAAVVAELTALGKSSPWPYQAKEDRDAEMAYWVDWLDAQQRIRMMWLGRLEALLTRHWPEVTRLLSLTSATLLRTLAHYGSPAEFVRDPEATRRLAGWGRSLLATSKIEKVIQSAKTTVGVRQNAQDVVRMKRYAESALSAYRETQEARRELNRAAEDHEVIQRLAPAVGRSTACVLWVTLGDPRNYHCGAAYRKAMGLNLKERSSGKHRGRLKITKRGPSNARRWLYYAAMRITKDPGVKTWYENKKAKDGDRGKGAVIAVARRLALALYGIAVRDEPFDARRLFPGKSPDRQPLAASSGVLAEGVSV